MLIPVDKERCQAEKPNGVTAFTLGGVPRMIRCNNKPIVIATEKEIGNDGLKGSMSLCVDCLNIALEQLPKGFFDVSEI
jgi:hypothetical protein